MSKCVRLYVNRDLGVDELAKSENGNWYYREYGFSSIYNAYTWTKWTKLGKIVNIERKLYTDDRYECGRVQRMIFVHFDINPCNYIIVKPYDKIKNINSVKYGRYRLPNE